jgi:hypothetical protein
MKAAAILIFIMINTTLSFGQAINVKDSVIQSLPKGAEEIESEANKSTYNIAGFSVYLNAGDAKVAPEYLKETQYGLYSKTLTNQAKYYLDTIKHYQHFKVLVKNFEPKDYKKTKIWFFCVNNTNDRCFNGWIEYANGERLKAETLLQELLNTTKFR